MPVLVSWPFHGSTAQNDRCKYLFSDKFISLKVLRTPRLVHKSVFQMIFLKKKQLEHTSRGFQVDSKDNKGLKRARKFIHIFDTTSLFPVCSNNLPCHLWLGYSSFRPRVVSQDCALLFQLLLHSSKSSSSEIIPSGQGVGKIRSPTVVTPRQVNYTKSVKEYFTSLALLFLGVSYVSS